MKHTSQMYETHLSDDHLTSAAHLLEKRGPLKTLCEQFPSTEVVFVVQKSLGSRWPDIVPYLHAFFLEGIQVSSLSQKALTHGSRGSKTKPSSERTPKGGNPTSITP